MKFPSITDIITTAVIVLLVLLVTAKMDEARAKKGKKFIFSPNL